MTASPIGFVLVWVGYWLNRIVRGWLRAYEMPWEQLKDEGEEE